MAKGRGLTSNEIELAREAHGDRLPYADIRLVNGPQGSPVAKMAFKNGNTAITLGRTIYYPDDYFHSDFAIEKPAARGLFNHELTHVWQYETLGRTWFLAKYGVQLARAKFNAPAMYDYDQGITAFKGAMLEAQAEMVGNYAEARAESNVAKMALIAKNLAGSGMFGL